MHLRTQNSKLKKTSLLTGKKTLDFALPAIKTCPFAGDCKKYCYASKGAYTWSNVKAKHEANYQATLRDDFKQVMFEEIVMSQAQAIRIHSSGDFYSMPYFMKWYELACALPHVTFYAYTKSYPYIVNASYEKDIPTNSTIIHSYGGKYDYRLDVASYRHAKVFKKGESIPMDYAIANDNDHVALATNHKIALIEH